MFAGQEADSLLASYPVTEALAGCRLRQSRNIGHFRLNSAFC